MTEFLNRRTIKLVLNGIILILLSVLIFICVQEFRDKRHLLFASPPKSITIIYYENQQWNNPKEIIGDAEAAKQFLSLVHESKIAEEIKDGPFAEVKIKYENRTERKFTITDTPMLEFQGRYYQMPKEKLLSFIDNLFEKESNQETTAGNAESKANEVTGGQSNSFE